MNQLPPIVLECPECGEKYLISRESYTPSENAVIYSDGFYIDSENWRTPFIIGCVTCELGFFPESGKIIAEPDSWEDFNENWAHIKKAEPPTAGSLALELRARKNMQLTAELALRKEFWYAGNHSETGRLLMAKNEKFKNFWLESLSKLEHSLSVTNDEELLLKAEINRQLGNFDVTLELLDMSSDNRAVEICKRALAKERTLFSFS